MTSYPAMVWRYGRMGVVREALILILSGLILSIAITEERWLYCLALAAIPALFFWPLEMSLGLYAMLVPFDSIALFGHYSGPGSTVSWYLGAAAGVVMLLIGIADGRFRRPPLAALWWGLLILWSSVTALWALDPGRSVERIQTAVALYLVYLLAVSLDISEQELARTRMLVVLGGAIVAGFACLQLLQGVGWNERASVIVGTSQTNPNKLAATLIVPFCLGIDGFVSSVSKRSKISWVALSTPIAIAICLSMSRGALLALTVAMLVFVIRSSSSARVILTISIAFALLIASSPPLLERIGNSLTSRGEGRIDIWQTGFAAVREYGVIGAGLDNFPIAYNKFAGSSEVFRGYSRVPHNVFLLAEVELGIIGFLLLLLAVISQLRDAISKKTYTLRTPSIPTVGYEAGCWGMLAMGLSEDNLWIKSFWIAWMLLAIAVRVNRRTLLEGRELEY